MVHGPGNYNEKSSLLRDQRPNRAASIGSDNGHRALAWSGGSRPTHAAQWSSRPRSRSRPRVSPGNVVVGCCGIGVMYIFIIAGLISLGLFLRAEFAQPVPPYVRKVAIIGKYYPIICGDRRVVLMWLFRITRSRPSRCFYCIQYSEVRPPEGNLG